MENITTITVKKSTKARLESFGQFNESFDELINRILDNYEEMLRRYVRKL